MPIATQDLNAPFDPTAYASITGAQLLQLITGATPYAGVGLVIATDDIAGVPQVPDANGITKWQNYVWLRITSTSAVPYIWNPNAASDATYLQWQTVAASSIGVGTIINAMIADNTIQDVKIANLSYSKLTGAPTGLPPSGAAGGILTGTYPNPSGAAGGITGTMIAGTTITHANMAAQAIQPVTDVLPNGVGLSILRTNAGATATEWATPAQTGARILQIGYAEVGTVLTSVGNLASSTVAPNANATGMTDSGINLAFTPISATSTFIIEVFSSGYSATASAKLFIGAYTGIGAVPPIGGVGAVSGASLIGSLPINFICKLASVGTTLLNFYVRFGVTGAASMIVNSMDGANQSFGIAKTTIKITEYL